MPVAFYHSIITGIPILWPLYLVIKYTVQHLLNGHPGENGWLLKRAGCLIEENPHGDYDYWLLNKGGHLIGVQLN